MGDTYPPPVPPATPEPHRRRRSLVVVLAATMALLLVGAAVAVPFLLDRWRELTTPTLDAVMVYEDLRTDHVEDEVDYDRVPPPGGPHAPVWLACGVYDVPVRDENAVHSLEHGTVWLSWRSDLPHDEVSRLAEKLPDEGIMAPYPGIDAPVVVTVWGRQLYLDGVDDPRLELFMDTYGDGHTAPEPMASCAGGVVPSEQDDTSSVAYRR